MPPRLVFFFITATKCIFTLIVVSQNKPIPGKRFLCVQLHDLGSLYTTMQARQIEFVLNVSVKTKMPINPIRMILIGLDKRNNNSQYLQKAWLLNFLNLDNCNDATFGLFCQLSSLKQYSNPNEVGGLVSLFFDDSRSGIWSSTGELYNKHLSINKC